MDFKKVDQYEKRIREIDNNELSLLVDSEIQALKQGVADISSLSDGLTLESLPQNINRIDAKCKELKIKCDRLCNISPTSHDLIPTKHSSVDILESDNLWVFKIADGFPHRIKEESGVYKYFYNRNALYNDYFAAVMRASRRYDYIRKFSGKTLLYIKNIYPSKNELVDHDNLDIKLFVDCCVKALFIKDDSPDLLSIYMDSAISTGPKRAEAILGDEKAVLRRILRSELPTT